MSLHNASAHNIPFAQNIYALTPLNLTRSVLISHCHPWEKICKRYAIFACPAGELIIASIEMPKYERARKSTNIQNISLNIG